ncbi:MAG: nuclear transport factor 2 family protein [Bacteroidetes bacterium]|nr:nuclear transport factor 2 family protein [Bacteroidota bacterium]
MKIFYLGLIVITFLGCKNTTKDVSANRDSINATLDNWHAAAAKADFETYFKLIADDGVFIGTDATENWNKKDFMVWAKPYFDKGKAWNFTSIERHIYFDKSNELAWFDELLSTQMKICRGSVVLVKENNEWKIKHYVLSMTIPNELVDTIVRIKAPIEDELMNKLNSK